MARDDLPPAPRRGTRLLGGDAEGPVATPKSWWRGAAIAGVGFALLVLLAVAVNMTKPDDPAPAPGSTSPPDIALGTPDHGAGVRSGGDPRTSGRQLVDGVPVGYPHTEAGAVQAAVNYQVARSSAAYFVDPATRHRVIDAMVTVESRETLTRNEDVGMAQALFSLGIDSGNADGDTLVARAAPLGTRIDSYSEQVATVEVWMAGLIGVTDERAPLPVSASWSTYTLTLQWQNDDWKLAAISSAAGPTPLDTGSAVPSSVAEFRSADEAFDAPPFVG
ncbi:hypothetical protein [Streptomyces sp. B6B3]|uniref:hypothetical protein n=1 Tax=Streptomyces sp. B6B3 TaxID=3153570 RepID=UPI00325F0FED